jgi:alpha-methylacyl-CoA racemase
MSEQLPLPLPLKGLKLLDCTSRLPGPLASSILSGLGAEVVKIEDINSPDAFKLGLPDKEDKSFIAWYNQFNQDKKIVSLDFNHSKTPDKIQDLLKEADGLLLGLSSKKRELIGLDINSLKTLKAPLAVIELRASLEGAHSLHDLNALAETGLLELYLANHHDHSILPPPFLPIAGISFAQAIATELLAALLNAQRENQIVFHTSSLLENTQKVLASFWPAALHQQKQFLHNGRYPCYNLYRLNDGSYCALAAIESKYWLAFCVLFDIPLKDEDRFSHGDKEIFDLLSQTFLKYNKKEMKDKIKGQNICLSLIN